MDNTLETLPSEIDEDIVIVKRIGKLDLEKYSLSVTLHYWETLDSFEYDYCR